MTRVFVYETTSADPLCADEELQAQGRSMRDAMLADLVRIDGLQVACAVSGEAPPATLQASRLVPEVSPVPEKRSAPGLQSVRAVRPAAGEAAADFLRRQARLHDLIWVVAPESDGLLANLRAAVTDRQWLGCSARAIAIAASKRTTCRQLQAAGIAATEPHEPGDLPSAAVAEAHWIVKPDDGCGAAGARRHRSFAQARADFTDRLRRDERVVMEPWIEGEPLSLSVLCGEREVEVLAVNRQRISVDRSGWLRFDGVSPYHASASQAAVLASLARRIVAAIPGLGGYIGVDLTWHPVRGPVVVEINPRVTCSYEGLSQRIGRNVAQQMLTMHRRAYAVAQSDALASTDAGPIG